MRKVLLIGVLAGVGTVLFAEGPRAAVDGSTADALLAEIRALRAESAHIMSAGIRMQLLIARLQLQEQRVVTAAQQHAEAQHALAAVQGRIDGERARVRQLEDGAAQALGQGRATYQHAIVEAGAQIEQQQRQELELQAREKELRRAVNDEQLRWADFNNRLDALERSLPANSSH